MKIRLIGLKIIIGVILLILFTNTVPITTAVSLDKQVTNREILSLESPSLLLSDLSLVPHEPIEILNDGNFTDYGFPGYGNESHPYIIESYNITTTEDSGIYITKTTKFFEIRNCLLDAENNGIRLEDIFEGTACIINNTCTDNNAYGIDMISASNSTLRNNTCINNFNGGIAIRYSSNSILTNNTCRYSEAVCIYATNSPGVYIINNTCSNSYANGISISSCYNATLINNRIFNGGVTIFENTIEAYNSYTLMDNWVKDKELGFFTNLVKTTLSDPIYGQLILVNCSETIIANQILFDATVGLFLYECNNTSILNNTSINNYYYGIDAGYCVNTTLVNNTFSSNRIGFFFSSSYNTSLINNTCNYNDRGIELRNSVNSTLKNNNCSSNKYSGGICLRDSLDSELINNNCSINLADGIYLWSSTNSTLTNNTCNSNRLCGIYGLRADFTNILNNTIVSNGFEGIDLSTSDFCLIIYNLIKDNTGFGIYLYYSSDNNIIHHNTLISNNLGSASQAVDYGSNNVWYDVTTNEGNWWDDWTGGDYVIDGSAGSVDPYPLGTPLISEFLQIGIIFPTLFLCLTLVSISFKKKTSHN